MKEPTPEPVVETPAPEEKQIPITIEPEPEPAVVIEEMPAEEEPAKEPTPEPVCLITLSYIYFQPSSHTVAYIVL